METKKRRAEELSYFNAVCCLLVVLIHVLSLGISKAEPTSWQAAVIWFPWRLSAFVVPAFLFSGGVKMAMGFGRTLSAGAYGRYFLGRIKKIYLPFVLWTVVYYLALLSIGYVRGESGELLRYLLVGNITAPFYYIVVVMQFYALQPLWFWLTRRVEWYTAFLCALLVTLAAQRLDAFLAPLGMSFPWADRIFPTYLIFWVAGLYAGEHYGAFSAALCRSRAGTALAAAAVLAVTVLAYVQYSRIWLLDLGPFKVVTDCLSILILLRACLGIPERWKRLRGMLTWIHGASFFVFLSHCLFLTLGNCVLEQAGVNKLSVLLCARFVICYTLPFALYWAWTKIKKLKA